MEKYNILLSLSNQKYHQNFIEIPGSKSYTNRAILIAAISNGKTIIKKLLRSDDTDYMIECLKNLGVEIIDHKNHLIVYGNNGKFKSIINNRLFCGLAGTTSRFLTALTLLINQDIEITGQDKILKRPIGDLAIALEKIGATTEYLGINGSLPLKIYGNKKIKNVVEISGKVSSQFISALLMIAPRLAQGLEINVIGDQVSKSYIDITINIMNHFGVYVKNDNYKKYVIKCQEYQAISEYNIEGDWSSASYFLALAGLINKEIKVNNIRQDSVQGDAQIIKILDLFGIKVDFDKTIATINQNNINNLEITVDMFQMPDTAMTIMVLSAILGKEITIKGLSTLKDKECDRIEIPKQELAKFGIKCQTTKDSIIIYGQTFNDDSIVYIDTFEDHRIAMAFSILVVKKQIYINNAHVVNKSFPNFWHELKKMGINIEKIPTNK